MAFVAAAALGATYAAWQASDTITGNTISTAELEIDAVGVASYGAVSKPIFAEDVLPGYKSAPAERAEITNNSSVALDLYFYIDDVTGIDTGACDAVALAWRASTPGDSSNFLGYGTAGDTNTYEATAVGPIAGYDADNTDAGLFSLVKYLVGPANAVKIADANVGQGFGPGDKIAIRQVAHFATDASYPEHSGSCTWTEYFIGTMPGKTPDFPEAE